MKTKRIASFEDLVATRYGAGSPKPARMTGSTEDLLRSYYGAPKAQPCAKPKTALASMQSRDDGEVLLQKSAALAAGQSMPAEVASPPPPTQTPAVRPDTGAAPSPPVPSPPAPSPPVPGDPIDRGLPDADRARQEELLDLAALNSAPGSAPPPPADPLKAAEVAPPRMPAPPTVPLPVPPPASDTPPKTPAEKEDEFLEDMKAIMSGRKAYDPASKQVVDRHGMTAPPEAHADPIPPPAAQPLPAVSSAHDIFTQIARSMEYAGAYDLGEVELENRFTQFDQADAARLAKSPPVAGPAPPAPAVPPAPKPPTPDEITADIQDMLVRPEIPAPPAPPKLEELLPSHGAVGEPAPSPPPAQPLSFETDRLPDYARPLFDTGEHVLAGETLYPDQLRVGPRPGVAFSYGDIIAMADLYETDTEMMGASLDELTRLKAKIRQSADYYRSKTGMAPGTGDWDAIIGERYLRLAEDNFTHFAPNILFPSKKFAAKVKISSKVGLDRENESEWRAYHRRAIDAARTAAIDPRNQNVSYIPEDALIINAFGDHFLTDAFASGHIFNKAEAMGVFFANFYDGDKLNLKGLMFFGRVAELAFRGDLKAKFSVLEKHDPVDLIVTDWRPNIDTESAFSKLLVGIANDKAMGMAKVANLAVKALHDKLNQGGDSGKGISVSNKKGKVWNLFGDGRLDPVTRGIMQEAVKQSVGNLLDPAIQASNLDYEAYFAKVWDYVPSLTPASRAEVSRLMQDLLKPDSEPLAIKAAAILTDEVDTLIQQLKDKKILQHE